MQRPIYLDYQATTPMDQRVLAAMTPYFTEYFGNASSQHRYGWEAESAIKNARRVIAESIHAQTEEIIFTSGATEANNLVIKGIAEAYFHQGKHLITVQTEHRAVLDPCRYLETLGFEVTYLSVNTEGLIDLKELEAAIRPDTILVSIMAANNEIGVLQPLTEIGKICRCHQVLFHTDAAQAIAKIPLNVETMQIDLMSLTAHKIYGPKGIGALYVRRRNPKVNLAPQMQGGGQEQGLRAGTLYTPQIVGFASAITLALDELETEAQRLTILRDKLWNGLKTLGGIHLNGHDRDRLPGNLNISVEGVKGTSLLLALQPHIALSSGSACSATSANPSHVLTALGRSKPLAQASLRFGLGRFTTEEEIDHAIAILTQTIQSLRASN
ncbi:MAG: IscS subfamily cysteine desulfurase [Snowella sp.]|nr:IscS subfamily cysteine desulfurase [Snowella sp.]